jgi:hypothetical protein
MNQGQNGGNTSQEDSMVQEVSMDEKKKVNGQKGAYIM